MTTRSAMLPLAFASALAIAACGGESDSSATTAVESAPATDSAPETTVDAPTAEASVEATDDDGAVSEPDGCNEVLTPEEIDSVFGSSVEIAGQVPFCRVIFASDAVGSLAVFSDETADEAMDELLPEFRADETASTNGILFAEDRGFVYEYSAVVRGDSGRVFRFDAPRSVDVPDIQAAMKEIADLLLAR